MPTCRPLLSATADFCDLLTTAVGRAVAWLTAVMAITVTLIVIARAMFDVGAIAAQESVTYMHALVIMLACAYTLKESGHVRVDIFYHRYTPLQKAWLDAFGTILFLVPLAMFMVLSSWEYVSASWAIGETSADAGGLPALYLLKSLILINGGLLIVQALAEISRQLLVLTYTDA